MCSDSPGSITESTHDAVLAAELGGVLHRLSHNPGDETGAGEHGEGPDAALFTVGFGDRAETHTSEGNGRVGFFTGLPEETSLSPVAKSDHGADVAIDGEAMPPKERTKSEAVKKRRRVCIACKHG